MSAVKIPTENVYGHTKKLMLLLNLINKKKQELGRPLNILDVGCGNGSAITQYLSQGIHNVLGIDIHQPSIEFAAQNYQDKTLSFSSINYFEIREIEFDLIVFADMLEHVSNPTAFLEHAKLLLRQHGSVFVSIPNGYGPFEIESAFVKIPFIGKGTLRALDYLVAFLDKLVLKNWWSDRINKDEMPYNHDSPHVQFFTRSSFESIVVRAGMSIKSHKRLSFLSGPITNYVFLPFDKLVRLNSRVADFLPSAMTSAWVFVL